MFIALLIQAVYLGAACTNTCNSGTETCASDSICRIACSAEKECSEKLGFPSELVKCSSKTCYQTCSHQGRCIYPAGQKCINGLCTMGCNDKQGCTSDQKCIKTGILEGFCGWKCKDKSCVPSKTSCGADGVCRSICTSDKKCRNGYVCKYESCFKKCTEDKECLSEGITHCWNGVCRQKCIQASDCPDGYMCSLNGDCEKVCHFNADCDVINGEMCVDGYCKTKQGKNSDALNSQIRNPSNPSSNKACARANKDVCPEGEICGADGVCRKECTKCQDKEECLYGSCFKICKIDNDCEDTSKPPPPNLPKLSCIGFHCMAVCVSDIDCTGGRLCSHEGTCNYQCKSVSCPHPSLCALDGVCRFKTDTCPDGYTKSPDDGFCYLTCATTKTDDPCDPTRNGENGKPLNSSIFEDNSNYNPQQLAAQATSPLNLITMGCASNNLCKAGCILNSDCSTLDACNQETHLCVRRADFPVLENIKACWHDNISLHASYGNSSFTLNVVPKNLAHCRAAFSTTAIVRLNLSDYKDTIVQTLSNFSLPDTREIRLVCNPNTIQGCKRAMITSTSAAVSIESATHIMSTTISNYNLEKYDYKACLLDMLSTINLVKLLDKSPVQLCALVVWNHTCPCLYTNKIISSTLLVHFTDGSVSRDDVYHLPPEIMTPSKRKYCTTLDMSNKDIASKVIDYFNDIWLTGKLLIDLLIDGVTTEVAVKLSGLSTAYMSDCVDDLGVIVSPISISIIMKGYESVGGKSCVIPDDVKQILLTTAIKDYKTNAFIVSERILPSFSYASTRSMGTLCGTGYRKTTSSKDCQEFFSNVLHKSLSTLNGYMRISLYDTVDDKSDALIRSIFYYRTYRLGCYNGTIVMVERTVLSLQLVEAGVKDCTIPTIEQVAVWHGVDLTNTTSTQVHEIGSLVYTLTAEIYTDSTMRQSIGKFMKQSTFSRNTDMIKFSCTNDWVETFNTEHVSTSHVSTSCQKVLAEILKKKKTILVGLTIDGVTNTSIHSGLVPSITIQSQDYTTTYIITFSFAGAFIIAANTVAIIFWVRLNKDAKALNLILRNQRNKRKQNDEVSKSTILGSN